MEVAYLRLEYDQHNIETLSFEPYQQIIYKGNNQYHTDVIRPKTSSVELHGITLSRDEFWSQNMPHLIKATVKPVWSHGKPMVSIDFNSDNLLTILRLCGTIYLQDDWEIFNVDNMILLHKNMDSKMHNLYGTQEYTIEQFKTIKSVLENARQTITDTYEDQLIRAFQHKHSIFSLKI